MTMTNADLLDNTTMKGNNIDSGWAVRLSGSPTVDLDARLRYNDFVISGHISNPTMTSPPECCARVHGTFYSSVLLAGLVPNALREPK